MLTQVDELSASGINNVLWDAVELPSQLMENFCYQESVIEKISGHYQTGEPLPETLLKQLIKSKNFQSGLSMLRQIEYALLDMRLYNEAPSSVEGIQAILDDIRTETNLLPLYFKNKYQNSFMHIFSGGYAAGYYSYKWAEVLSSDAFSLFEEKGIMDPSIGKKWLTTVLEKGGSCDPMELFIHFRGRKPNRDALLKHSGIKSCDFNES
jgi:oligopeptidase A